MKYKIVLPSIWPEYTESCLASMAPEVRENVMVIDNTADNIGVTASWNQAVRQMSYDGCDWLILLSAAIVFKEGGLDFIREIEKREYDYVVEANNVFGWHLIAFNWLVFEEVGLFDENLVSYFADIDFSLRIQKIFKVRPNWDKVDVALEDRGMAHGVKLAGVNVDDKPLILYFVNKFGRHPGAHQLGEYEHPFNNPEYTWKYWPTYDRSRNCVL